MSGSGAAPSKPPVGESASTPRSSWIRQPVMPIMAPRPFWRSTFSLYAFSPSSSYRTQFAPPMSPGALSSVCFVTAHGVAEKPVERRDRLERREAARRHIGELEVLRRREVALKAHAGLDVDDVQEAKHGRAAVLDLHDLVTAHVARLNQTQRVEKAEGRQNAQGAAESIRRQVLLTHASRDALGRGTQRGRGLEGLDRLQERKGSDGDGAHVGFGALE